MPADHSNIYSSQNSSLTNPMWNNTQVLDDKINIIELHTKSTTISLKYEDNDIYLWMVLQLCCQDLNHFRILLFLDLKVSHVIKCNWSFTLYSIAYCPLCMLLTIPYIVCVYCPSGTLEAAIVFPVVLLLRQRKYGH